MRKQSFWKEYWVGIFTVTIGPAITGSLFNWGFGVGWENNVTVIIELITSIPVMFGIWKLLHLIRGHIFKQVDTPNEIDLLDDYDSIRRD
jgi:hypothetical protein